MKTLSCAVAAVALSVSAPAMAQAVNGGGSFNIGGGYTSIWSSAQGTSFSYGTANGYGNSSAGSMAFAGGSGLNSLGAITGGSGMTAITTSTAGTASNGSGYAQAQTSGYAGGSVSTFGATRTH
jgi:hypothetical protein